MKTIFYLLLLSFFGCNQNQDLNQIFRNEKYKILFKEFCKEAVQSDYRDGNDIIVSSNGEASNEFCVIFSNIQNYKSNDSFGKFKYNGFDVYVNRNVPKSVIELHDYNKKIKKASEMKNEILPTEEFLQMYICYVQDTLKVKKVNFENNKFINEWQIIN
ncbi:MAG: hypothetical protein WCY25_10160 [Moheibacter sp.]